MPERIVIVGGGVGGLTTALALGRAGHRVTLLERDELAPRADAEEAFAAERRGAPQVHQTHGFLARIQVVMGERFPDVLATLLARGAMRLPTTVNLGEPEPGDEQLEVVIMRRTTLDWVLREAAMAEPNVEVSNGVAVAGLTWTGGTDAPPTVDGVELADGTRVEADAVVLATGRRGAVGEWLTPLGVRVAETVRESGLMYMTRWYRHPPELDPTQLNPKLGGDLGFVKYLGVPGDGGTLSITLAIRADDGELRRSLADADTFDRACRLLPGPDQFFRHDLTPIGGVRPMGGLLNRLRRFVDEAGQPLVLGVHAVGDVHTCTNPLYGRGCSLAMVQAVALADAMAAHPGDPAARAATYEAACDRDIRPWFDLSVEMDRMGSDPAGFGSGEVANPLAPVFAAAATDPVLGRGFARLWNLLATPAELAADQAYTARVMEVMAEPDKYPLPPREGPQRAELLEQLGVTNQEASRV